MKRIFLGVAILMIAMVMLYGCGETAVPATSEAPVEVEHSKIYAALETGDGYVGNGTAELPFGSVMRAAAFVKNGDYAGPTTVDVYVTDMYLTGATPDYDFYATWNSVAPILLHPLDEDEGCEWVMILIVGTDSSISDAYDAFRISGCREGYLYTLTQEGRWKYKETLRTGGPLYHPAGWGN